MSSIREPARELHVLGDYDVVVCGGGTAGMAAAISAARCGARTAVVERYGFVGGVPAFSIMPCWHHMDEHASGLLREFGDRVATLGNGPSPWTSHSHMEPEAVKITALRLLEEAGVALHLHSWLADAVHAEGRLAAVVVEEKCGRAALRGRVFIDASGDGDLSARVGAALCPDVGQAEVQGMTLRFRIGHVDFPALFAWLRANPDCHQLHPDWFATIAAAQARGEAFFLPTRIDRVFDRHRAAYPRLPENTYFNTSCIRPGELSVNCTRVYGLDGTSSRDLARAELTCRQQAWAVWTCLRDQVPGFAGSLLTETAAQVGVRESRRVLGDYVLSAEDCLNNAEFPDAVCTASPTFDLHNPSGYRLVQIRGVVDVPFRCFTVRGFANLLLAGRILSSDHDANSGLRRMENVFQAGQVVGTAAALAARRGCDPRHLLLGELRERLEADGIATSARWRLAHGRLPPNDPRRAAG